MKETKEKVKGWVIMSKTGNFVFTRKIPHAQVYLLEDNESCLLEDSYVLPAELTVSFPELENLTHHR